jgi:hypothetical protein
MEFSEVANKDLYFPQLLVLIMNSGRTLTWLLVILLLTSLLVLTITPANVQAASKPSVPQFTIKLVDYYYDTPPSTTTITNPFNGEKTTTTITPGHHIEDKRIEITVKNQPFTPYTDTNGNKCNLYYTIEYKGHFGDYWGRWCLELEQTKSQYTISPLMHSIDNYAAGDQLDFRVKAKIGYLQESGNPLMADRVVSDVTSGWSKIQTFTISGSSLSAPSSQTISPQNSTAPSDNNQPQQPEQTQPSKFVFPPTVLLWIGSLLFAGAAIAVVAMFTKKHLKTPNYNNPQHNQ